MPSPKTTFWKSERKIQQLRTLWSENHSVIYIADELSCDPRTVSRKASELGLNNKRPVDRRNPEITPVGFWSKERLDQLCQLWNEGLSTAKIGLKLGCTKNAAIGKVHHLKLLKRPSPIRQKIYGGDQDGQILPLPPPVKRIRKKKSLPTLSSTKESVMEASVEVKSEVCEAFHEIREEFLPVRVEFGGPIWVPVNTVHIPEFEAVLKDVCEDPEIYRMDESYERRQAIIDEIVENLPVFDSSLMDEAIPQYSVSSRTCQWTDSTRRPWVFCDCKVKFGSSWCAVHHRRVYQPSGKQQFKAA